MISFLSHYTTLNIAIILNYLILTAVNALASITVPVMEFGTRIQ